MAGRSARDRTAGESADRYPSRQYVGWHSSALELSGTRPRRSRRYRERHRRWQLAADSWGRGPPPPEVAATLRNVVSELSGATAALPGDFAQLSGKAQIRCMAGVAKQVPGHWLPAGAATATWTFRQKELTGPGRSFSSLGQRRARSRLPGRRDQRIRNQQGMGGRTRRAPGTPRRTTRATPAETRRSSCLMLPSSTHSSLFCFPVHTE